MGVSIIDYEKKKIKDKKTSKDYGKSEEKVSLLTTKKSVGN